jgi:hypothetical protein
MLQAAVLVLCGVGMVVWAVGWGGCALYCKLWFVRRQVGLVIVSVLGWCLWSLELSRTVGEFFVRSNCVIYGRSGLIYESKCQTVAVGELVSTVGSLGGLSKCQTVAAGELVSTVNGLGVHDRGLVSTVSDLISTVSRLRFHDGQLRFHESDLMSPPVSFAFP